MNHIRTTLLHAIAAALAFLSTTALADIQIVDGIEWTYTVTGATASVGFGDRAVPISTSGAISIPALLDGHPVTGIESYAFNVCTGLTSVTIPNSVTNIGFAAFKGCSALASLAIPDSVTSVGGSAFDGCSGRLYDTKTLPGVCLVDGWAVGWTNSLSGVLDLAGVRGIAGWAFNGCIGLTSATIGNGVTDIGDYAFDGCSGMTNVTIPGSVTSIGEVAFRECTGLTSVIIPDGVTSIGHHAFEYCSGLTNVTIPDSVTSIGEYAFEGCNRLCDTKNRWGVCLVDGWVVDCTNSLSGSLDLTELRGIAPYAFGDCTKLTNVTIPDSMTSVGKGAFIGCSGLKSVTIPGSVACIGDYAFSRCSDLTGLALPDGVTSIGEYAFSGCSSLTNVAIPDSVTTIGDCAFSMCRGLTDMSIQDSVTSIGTSAFEGCNGLTTLYVPVSWEGTTMLDGAGVPEGCRVEYSVLPQPRLALGASRTFRASASSRQELAVTANISWTAQSSTSWLTLATASGSGNGTIIYSVAGNTAATPRTGTITVVGDGLTRTFSVRQEGLVKWRYVVNGETATLTAADPAEGYLAIPSVLDGHPVARIGSYAFYDCNDLTSVTIPDSVTSIGDYAFEGCGALATLYVPASWKGTAKLDDAGIPGGCTVVYRESPEAEVTTTGVPCNWIDENAAEILASNGGDHEAAATALAANLRPVWECYVAGLSTTNATETFKVKSISIENGEPVVEWAPDLNEDGTKTERSYILLGKRSLSETNWTELPDETDVDAEGWRFFRVLVKLPE